MSECNAFSKSTTQSFRLIFDFTLYLALFYFLNIRFMVAFLHHSKKPSVIYCTLTVSCTLTPIAPPMTSKPNLDSILIVFCVNMAFENVILWIFSFPFDNLEICHCNPGKKTFYVFLEVQVLDLRRWLFFEHVKSFDLIPLDLRRH